MVRLHAPLPGAAISASGSGPESASDSLDRAATRWTGAILALLVVALFASVRYPPLYDYYHWLYQGDLLGTLLTGGQGAGALHRLYAVNWAPIPNLGAPVALALLTRVATPLVAGRVLLALLVLGLTAGYARIVRAVQERPSALELFALPWALGYFLYKGYLSYLLSLVAALFAVAVVHRAAGVDAPTPARRRLALLALQSAGVYLVHLMGWAVLALATSAYALQLALAGQRRRALHLLATLAPAVVMFCWYAVQFHAAAAPPSPYHELSDKLVSMMSGTALFVRLDPFPPVVPIGVTNLVALAALIALGLACRERRGGTASAPLLWSSAVLALLAIAWPIKRMAGMIRPDERFVLPAILLAVAALRHKRATTWARAALALALALVVALHGIEYRSASRGLAQALAISAPVVGARDSVLSLSIYGNRSDPGCEGEEDALAIASPAAKWFGLARIRARDARVVPLMETSAVRWLWPSSRVPDVSFRTITPEELEPLLSDDSLLASYGYVEVYGCPADLDAVREAGAPLVEVGATDRYALFRRDPSIHNGGQTVPSGSVQAD